MLLRRDSIRSKREACEGNSCSFSSEICTGGEMEEEEEDGIEAREEEEELMFNQSEM
jgi:hypothetical protein